MKTELAVVGQTMILLFELVECLRTKSLVEVVERFDRQKDFPFEQVVDLRIKILELVVVVQIMSLFVELVVAHQIMRILAGVVDLQTVKILVGVEFVLQKGILFAGQVVVLQTMKTLVEVVSVLELQIMSLQQVFVQIMMKRVLLMFALQITILW